MISKSSSTKPTEYNANKPDNIKDRALTFKRIYDHMLVGYDFSKPKNITSHEFDSVEECEDMALQRTSKPAKFQILQQSDRNNIKAIRCSVVRSKHISHCGHAHHSATFYKNGYILKLITVTAKSCRARWEKRYYSPTSTDNKVYPIERNKVNRVAYYRMGRQYPTSDATGTSIMCEGNNLLFKGEQ